MSYTSCHKQDLEVGTTHWIPNQRSLGHPQRISTPRGGRCLLTMMPAKRFLSSPMLRAKLIHRTGLALSVRTITRHLLAEDIIVVGRYDALDWLKCTICKTSFGTSTTLSSLASQDSDCITQTGDLGCVGGIVQGTLVFVCREQMMMSVHPSPYEGDFTMMTNVSWLCWTTPWTSKCTDVCCNKVFYPGREPPPRTTVPQSPSH